MTAPASTPARPRGLLSAGVVLGVALGGFFDGVMLHQVLRWHHLLSLKPGESFARWSGRSWRTGCSTC
jgi:uncharacterized membrane protein